MMVNTFEKGSDIKLGVAEIERLLFWVLYLSSDVDKIIWKVTYNGIISTV